MISYKRLQAKNNKDSIFFAVQQLNKPVSSTEIEQYLKEKAMKEAQIQAKIIYNSGKFSSNERDEYIARKSMSMHKRTIQRWLAELTLRGLLIQKNNKYLLSSRGKHEFQFRDFASGYGSMALNNIMNCHFPTVSTLEENLIRLAEIFGVYVVYCLIESARLIRANASNQEDYWYSYYFGHHSDLSKEGRLRDRELVNLWIKNVFYPWQMLNLFFCMLCIHKHLQGWISKLCPLSICFISSFTSTCPSTIITVLALRYETSSGSPSTTSIMTCTCGLLSKF
jgi:hypothetical protein